MADSRDSGRSLHRPSLIGRYGASARENSVPTYTGSAASPWDAGLSGVAQVRTGGREDGDGPSDLKSENAGCPAGTEAP